MDVVAAKPKYATAKRIFQLAISYSKVPMKPTNINSVAEESARVPSKIGVGRRLNEHDISLQGT